MGCLSISSLAAAQLSLQLVGRNCRRDVRVRRKEGQKEMNKCVLRDHSLGSDPSLFPKR